MPTSTPNKGENATSPSSAPGASDGRRHPLYRTVRVVLFLLSAGLLSVSLGGISRSFDLVLHAGDLHLPESDQAFEKTVGVQLAKATATLDYDAIILEALDEEDIHRAEIYVNVAKRFGFEMRPETVERFEDATDWSSTILRSGKQAGKGFMIGEIGDAASFTGAIAADLSGFGDLRDIATHGGAYLNGKPYDDLILGLSIAGLAVTVLDPSQVVNTGAAVLKGAGRFRRTSQPLQRQLRHIVGETVDMEVARSMVRNPTAEAAAKVVRRSGMNELRRTAVHAGTIYENGGGKALTMALRHADSVDDLSLFARVSRSMGKQADEVIEVAGKRLKTAFRAHKVTLRTGAIITGWATALVGAVIGLLSALSETIARRLGTQHVLAWLAAHLAKP